MEGRLTPTWPKGPKKQEKGARDSMCCQLVICDVVRFTPWRNGALIYH